MFQTFLAVVLPIAVTIAFIFGGSFLASLFLPAHLTMVSTVVIGFVGFFGYAVSMFALILSD